MRYIAIHKTNPETEAGAPPSAKLVAEMGPFVQKAMQAGVLKAAEGLRPTSTGVRLNFKNGKQTVTNGPFPGVNEFAAGFCILRVKSMDDAIQWTSRFAGILGDAEVDIRPVCEPWDLGMMPKPAGLETTRFMAVHKADAKSESGAPADPADMAAMGQLMEEMTAAGVLVMAEGIQPGSKSTRLHYVGGKRTVVDGPFAESKELIAGFAILDVASKEDAIEWTDRFAEVIGDVEVDLRPLYEEAAAAA